MKIAIGPLTVLALVAIASAQTCPKPPSPIYEYIAIQIALLVLLFILVLTLLRYAIEKSWERLNHVFVVVATMAVLASLDAILSFLPKPPLPPGC